MRRPLRVSGVNDGIVVNHHDPVTSRVHIELDAIGSQLDRSDERGDGVLGVGLVSAPVRDSLGAIAASAYGQAFLSVVALCWMSAKL